MEDQQKLVLFEQTPIPRAVMQLAVPTILSSQVMVLYNLADTYFVGMLNDPIENAAVTSTSVIASLRGLPKRAMAARAAQSKTPAFRNALATASTQNRHPMVFQSK